MTMPSKTEARVTYVDRPEISETFADAVQRVAYQGSVCRIELAVTRLHANGVVEPPKPEKVTAARLVLTAQAMADLCTQLKVILDRLEQQGKVTRQPATPQSVQ
jgi:hypothetical protein